MCFFSPVKSLVFYASILARYGSLRSSATPKRRFQLAVVGRRRGRVFVFYVQPTTHLHRERVFVFCVLWIPFPAPNV